MPSRADVSYFGAGPAPLPTAVLEEASKVLLSYNDSGIGITEISHRSADATAILTHAQDSLRKLLDIPSGDGPDGYQILFMHGGGSGEFSASVYHMTSIWVEKRRQEIVASLGADGSDDAVFEQLRSAVASELKLDYLVTGSWSLKASQEAARLVGPALVNVALDARTARDGKFGAIPAESTWELSQSSAMVYFCDNETVDGVEFPAFPEVLADGKRLVVADMSSNFLSRKVDVRKYAAIFGGAQKNIGTTGITLAIVRNDLLPPHAAMAKPDLLRRLGLPVGPVVLDWPTVAKNGSLYNTLPIFDVWVAGKVMQGLLDKFGSIDGQQQESVAKAKAIYGALEKHSHVFSVVPTSEARSRMNICFTILGEGKEKAFLAGAAERNLLGCKGHRSVGGCRVSNYNAVTVQSVEKLVRWLDDFVTSS